jgi:hypothetical protein
MPTFEEKLGIAEAQRIAYESFQKVTQSGEPVIDMSATFKDCGITTQNLRDRLLGEVDRQVQLRGFKIKPQYLRVLHFDSEVGSLVQTILYSLPGDEDFEEPSEDVSDFQNPLKRKR